VDTLTFKNNPTTTKAASATVSSTTVSKTLQQEYVIWPNIQCIRRVTVQLKHYAVQYCTQVTTTARSERRPYWQLCCCITTHCWFC